jgi:hypothetical protein
MLVDRYGKKYEKNNYSGIRQTACTAWTVQRTIDHDYLLRGLLYFFYKQLRISTVEKEKKTFVCFFCNILY